MQRVDNENKLYHVCQKLTLKVDYVEEFYMPIQMQSMNLSKFYQWVNLITSHPHLTDSKEMWGYLSTVDIKS